MRYRLTLLALLLALFVALAIAPPDRETWALENALFVAALVFLVATRRKLAFSTLSYTLIAVFLALHEIGAHYTYSYVPYERWIEALTGRTLASLFGWQRNHYDRLVHLAFGLLLAYPMRELFLRLVDARGVMSYVLPIQMTLSWSALYELIEWVAALVFGGDTGAAYLGLQGDEWDSQKDMALAGAGAVIALFAAALSHRVRGRDPQRERMQRERATATARAGVRD